ncbi:hypothetical protein LDENG_00161190, partial [Lucifuga dentata]
DYFNKALLLYFSRFSVEAELRKERGHHVDTASRLSITPQTGKQVDSSSQDQPDKSPSVRTETGQLKVGQEDLSSNTSSFHHEDEEEDVMPSVCTMCEQEESLHKLKKRCRNCSRPFCQSCVENQLPLPSCILPQHVCDQCYALLLQQYAGSPP